MVNQCLQTDLSLSN